LIGATAKGWKCVDFSQVALCSCNLVETLAYIRIKYKLRFASDVVED